MKLIEKAALVAEIERKKNEEVDYDEDSKNFASYADQIHYQTLDSIEDFIDTLEVKDVDLESEIDNEWKKCNPIDEGMGVESAFIHVEAFDMIAKHFFELGLTQKGDKNMKAPKKLYLRKRCKLPYDVVQNEWYVQPPISVYGSIEYIRKDALMDYLHERKEQQDQWVKKCHDMVSQSVSMELEQLINKLESV